MGAVETVLEARAQISGRCRDTYGAEMIDDAGRGNLAGIMAAHAVSHHPDAAAGFHQEPIFIQVAHAAAVAEPIAFKRQQGFIHGTPPSGAPRRS